MKFRTVSLLVLFLSILSYSEDVERKIYPIPFIASSPETSLLMGAMGMYYEKSETGNLSINFGGMYTLKNQTSIFLEGLKKT
ncbi:MAG: hypothetical protein ACQERZ_07465, partial [Fusobacteriota bacterium]